MASSTNKTTNTSKDPTYDLDWVKNTNASSFIKEERRLNKKKPVTNQISQKRLGKFNALVNQMTPEQLDEELNKRQLSTSGEIEIRRTRLKNNFKCEFIPIEQQFEYIAVVDFEATCEENQGDKYPHEIIEFPIVLIDVQKQTIIDKFQSYCRPVKRPILTKFCTDLTGIEQHQVDNAPVFTEVLQNVETWLNERKLLSSSNKRRLAFATDGPWDFANFLRMQCHFCSIPFPRWAKKWINIRKEFANFYDLRRCGIIKMLGKLGLTFDGRHHSGLADATNIARVAIELLKDGSVLLLNDGIRASDPKFAEMVDENIEDNDEEEKGGEAEEDESIVFQD